MKDLSEEEESNVKEETDKFVKEWKIELGITIGLGILNYIAVVLCFLKGNHQLGLYFISLSVYHFAEFMFVA